MSKRGRTTENIGDTTLRLVLPSLTLNKHDVRALCDIVIKASVDTRSSFVRFIVSGRGESVSTTSANKLVNAKWPQVIDHLSLEAFDDNNIIRVLTSSRPTGTNEILISSSDSDWVTMRVKEIEDYLSEHKNWHWILHSVPWVFSILLALSACLGLGIGLAFKLPFEGKVMIGVFGFMGFFYIWTGINRLYPFVLVEGNRSSSNNRLRRFVNWIIPSVVLGLVINLVWQLLINM